MIVFSHKFGQLGNRLFAFAHLIANAAANNASVVNLSFDEYARYFQGSSQDILCRYPPEVSISKSRRIRSVLFFLNRILLKLLKKMKLVESGHHSIVVADLPEYQFGSNRHYDLNSKTFQLLVKQKPVIFLFGRFFRDYTNFERHQNVIREFFRPTAGIQVNVEKFIVNARKDTELLIGVHIRRGDYAQFVGGKYFFSQEDYSHTLEMMSRSIPVKKFKFVLCSNERIDEKIFTKVNFLVGPGHLVEDMYVLSSCDLILGPPSTYSTWASFYGRKPLYQLKNAKDLPTYEDFKILPAHLLYNF